MYYLQSRYYDAEIGRFINADDVNLIPKMQTGIKGTNLFEYCDGNPVNRNDQNGFYSVKISYLAYGILCLIGYNSIGIVLAYVGYVKFKRMLLKKYAKLVARISMKIPTWIGKAIGIAIGIMGIPSVVDLISALWDAFNMGYKYLSTSLKKNRWGYYYRVDFRATRRRC